MTTCIERERQTGFSLECICVPTCTDVAECSYFEDEVWRRARSHCRSEDPVMVRVDQRLVQVQNQNLPLYCILSYSHKIDT